jgi:mono/diheme cytochrome c family protein
MKTRGGGLAAALAALVLSFGASAADVAEGERLARQWCSNCHVVGAEQSAGGDAAPTFASIAKTSAERSDDLRAWLADPHPPMPNFNLTVREIEDLLGYIDSLGP